MEVVKFRDVKHMGGNWRLWSPLRWPGGKTAAVTKLVKFIPDGVEVVSPFIGGGSVEIAMGCSDVTVRAYDLYGPLCEFWQCACDDDVRGELVDVVKRHYRSFRWRLWEGDADKSRQWFMSIKGRMDDPSLSKVERAAAVFVVNRTARSGNIYNGGMNNPDGVKEANNRFNRLCIDRLMDFKSPGLRVEQADFRDSIARNPQAFLFLDPPYPDVDAIYTGHDGFPWGDFAEVVTSRDRWVCCLNDVPVVHEMFKGFRAVQYELNWSMAGGVNTSKKSNEILILSEDVVLPHGYSEFEL